MNDPEQPEWFNKLMASVRDVEEAVDAIRARRGIESERPTIREMLDKMEEKRTCDAPCLVAMLRLAVNTLNWYANGQGPETRLEDNGDLATTTLGYIERGLWATSPRELWCETPKNTEGPSENFHDER